MVTVVLHSFAQGSKGGAFFTEAATSARSIWGLTRIVSLKRVLGRMEPLWFFIFHILVPHIFDHLRLVKQITSAAVFPKALLFQLSAHVKVQLCGRVFFSWNHFFSPFVQSSLSTLNHGQVGQVGQVGQSCNAGGFCDNCDNTVTTRRHRGFWHLPWPVQGIAGPGSHYRGGVAARIINLSAMMCDYASNRFKILLMFWFLYLNIFNIFTIFNIHLRILETGRVYSDNVGTWKGSPCQVGADARSAQLLAHRIFLPYELAGSQDIQISQDRHPDFLKCFCFSFRDGILWLLRCFSSCCWLACVLFLSHDISSRVNWVYCFCQGQRAIGGLSCQVGWFSREF